MPLWQTHTADAFRYSPHRASISTGKTDCFAFRAEQHYIAVIINNRGTDEIVIFNQVHSTQTHAARSRVLLQRGLLHRAVGGGHNHKLISAVFFNWQDRADALTFIERQQVNHWTPARIAAGNRNLINFEPINLTQIGKAQNCRVSASHQQMLNKIFVFHRGGRLTHAAATLSLIITQRLSLGIAAVGDGDNTIFFSNQIFYGEVVQGFNNFTATLVTKLFNNGFELFTNHIHQSHQVAENILVVGDFFKLDGELVNNLAVLHAR